MFKKLFRLLLLYLAYGIVLAHHLVPHHHHGEHYHAVERNAILPAGDHDDDHDFHHLLHSLQRYPHAGNGNDDISLSHLPLNALAKYFAANFDCEVSAIPFPVPLDIEPGKLSRYRFE